MSMFFSTVCLLVTVTSLHVGSAPVSPILSTNNDDLSPKNDSKSLHFVDLIKQNLRKNNDDYVSVDVQDPKLAGETRRQFNDTDGNSPYIAPAVQPTPSSNPEDNLPSDQRPVNDDLIAPRASKNRNAMPKDGAAMGNIPILSNDQKSGIKNWKLLMEKNKRLRMYTSTAKIEPSSGTVTEKGQSHTPDGRGRSGKTKRNPEATRARPLHAALPLRSLGPGRAPPNADQLDMAPARGAYIHDLRLKGRFCHRNVLWPEGPKYDSKGNIFMPAFDPKVGHQVGKSFVETTTALFVLPRCCNCCKKSVLGCQ